MVQAGKRARDKVSGMWLFHSGCGGKLYTSGMKNYFYCDKCGETVGSSRRISASWTNKYKE